MAVNATVRGHVAQNSAWGNSTLGVNPHSADGSSGSQKVAWIMRDFSSKKSQVTLTAFQGGAEKYSIMPSFPPGMRFIFCHGSDTSHVSAKKNTARVSSVFFGGGPVELFHAYSEDCSEYLNPSSRFNVQAVDALKNTIMESVESYTVSYGSEVSRVILFAHGYGAFFCREALHSIQHAPRSKSKTDPYPCFIEYYEFGPKVPTEGTEGVDPIESTITSLSFSRCGQLIQSIRESAEFNWTKEDGVNYVEFERKNSIRHKTFAEIEVHKSDSFTESPSILLENYIRESDLETGSYGYNKSESFLTRIWKVVEKIFDFFLSFFTNGNDFHEYISEEGKCCAEVVERYKVGFKYLRAY